MILTIILAPAWRQRKQALPHRGRFSSAQRAAGPAAPDQSLHRAHRAAQTLLERYVPPPTGAAPSPTRRRWACCCAPSSSSASRSTASRRPCTGSPPGMFGIGAAADGASERRPASGARWTGCSTPTARRCSPRWCWRVGQRFGVRFDEFHNDSTSITLVRPATAPPAGRAIRGRSAPAITYGLLQGPPPGSEAAAVHPDHERRRRRPGARFAAPTATPATRAPTSRPGTRCARWPAAPTSCTWPTASFVRDENMHHIDARRRALRHRDAAQRARRTQQFRQWIQTNTPGLGAGLGPAQPALQRRAARLLVRLPARRCPRRRSGRIVWVWSTLLDAAPAGPPARSNIAAATEAAQRAAPAPGRRPSPAARRRRDRPAGRSMILEQLPRRPLPQGHARGARGAQLQAGAPRPPWPRHRLPQDHPAGASTSSGPLDEDGHRLRPAGATACTR
ncbi:MAG: hypothetical protein MZW92_20210 [Comamonadaceae bacterium]|nr:hypothetical protein [Comamonadaceae bacterium]